MSIGIDFGIGIDENSWYRPGIVSKPKKLVSPIPTSKVPTRVTLLFVNYSVLVIPVVFFYLIF